jgi:hypothetical protein
MRGTLRSTLATVGLLGGLLAVGVPPAAAQQDVAKEARLLTLEGKFSDAETLLRNAPEEIRKDPELRKQLGKQAVKWARRKRGVEKVPGLLFARGQYSTASELQPEDVEAATEAIEAALELVEIQIEAKQPDAAKGHAKFAVSLGESVLDRGTNTVDLRLGTATAHDHLAKLSHKIQEFDTIVESYDRSAELLVSCADEAKKPAEALGQAARVYLDLALFIAEGRPIDEETRDEEALKKGIEIAKKACETKGAGRDQFTIHTLLLRELYRAKVEGDFGKPYMEELGKREGIDGLDIQIPKTEGWKRLEQTGDWDMVLERKLEGDDTAVQVMIRVYSFSESFGGKTWDRVEDTTALRFKDQKSNDFTNLAKEVEPERVEVPGVSKKKAPEIWHFELYGKGGGRQKWVSEYTMLRSKKEKRTYHIRIIDWRVSPDIGEPDLVHFVEQALGLVPEDDKKKKKKRR